MPRSAGAWVWTDLRSEQAPLSEVRHGLPHVRCELRGIGRVGDSRLQVRHALREGRATVAALPDERGDAIEEVDLPFLAPEHQFAADAARTELSPSGEGILRRWGCGTCFHVAHAASPGFATALGGGCAAEPFERAGRAASDLDYRT